ncbi:HAD-like domain-containing protein [Naematelia encephala]|uniref:HAD-like domain-containing protein n=1 Tax=Naematelia encephala TaxID=71784 RepID=A0A1Y2B1U1_9TREE|nr:HAD-like domain-containing protein [Naematelia encephala]
MTEPTPISPPTVVALPDVASSPSDPKKPRLTPPTTSTNLPVSSSDNAEASSSQSTEISPEQGGGGSVMTPVVVAEPLPDDEVEVTEEWWDLRMTWGGKVWEIRVGGNDMLYDFRAKLETLTAVPAASQKIIGLTKGKLSAELDSTRFGALGVKKGCKFTMIGTPEAQVFKDPSLVKLPEIFDDFDMQYPSHPTGKGGGILPADDPRNKRKVQEVIQSCPITVMNEPRPGKKLLVLDLDYTIVDTKPLLEGSLPAEECARPGLHEFLESVYEHYDIVVWSQTHWRWLESKLVELGMIGGTRNYRICFVSDRTTMFPIFSKRGGKIMKHEVKPLAYFWAKFPEWSQKNTIHIDDLARNFALNPGEGLKIRAFKSAGTLEGLQDRELLKLGPYVGLIRGWMTRLIS